MHKKQLSVVIDTNVWISALFGGDSGKYLRKLLLNKNIIVLISDALKEEVLKVVSRPKFRKLISGQELDDLEYVLTYRTRYIKTRSKVSVSRDKNDDFLFALCKDGEADFLISGDKDVTILPSYGKTKIVTLRAFLNIAFL